MGLHFILWIAFVFGFIAVWFAALYLLFRMFGIRLPLGKKEHWVDLTKKQSSLCLLSLVGSIPTLNVVSDWLYSRLVDLSQPAFSFRGLVGSLFTAVILGLFGFREIEKLRMKYRH